MFFILSGCRKESTYWEDDFVAPLAHGSLTLGSMFPDTLLKSNPDSTLKIAFETTLINYGIDSLLKIPDTTLITVSTNTFFPIEIHPGDLLFSNTSESYYNFPNGIQLTHASIRQGHVKVELVNTVGEPLEYHYKLLSGKKNNLILDTIFKIPPATYSAGVFIAPGTNSCTINLAGYDIDFTGLNHNLNNTIDQSGDVSVSSTAAPKDTIYVNKGLTSKFTFTGIIPQYAQGYFGNQTVTIGPDTTGFKIFKTIKSGMLNLNSANVNLKIINEFGVAMRATIAKLSATSTPNATTTVLTSTVINTPYNINGAINNGPNAPVTASAKTITLNNNNSNITSFIGILPDKFIYKLNTQLNPAGNQGGNNDFAYYGTGFKAYLNADIPLYFSASNIVLADTVALNLSNINQFKNINHGQLILTAENSYPFSINLQGYLLDANKHVIDILFATPNTIQAPMLDANFKVIAPMQSKLFVPLNTSKIANLQKAKYIYYSATFNTASQPNRIKFYDYYALDLLLTADINYTIGK
ncbi:MAG TPA: hypothetical protein VNZ49_12775 [Bacteroidia bacterium]|nr:hypothetical protein [Bacteroidia bacterium]